jgi:long-chain acyl-CoA synthetase
MSVAAAFLATARGQPDHPFIVDRDDTVHTYGAVHAAAHHVAAHLHAAGLQPGDRVLLTAPNSADFVAKYLGILLTGAVAVLADHTTPPDRLEHIRSHSGAALTLTTEPLPASPGFAGPAPDTSAALIIYTSGTTGSPKGVVLTHANLCHTVDAIRHWAKVASGERELLTLPLTHLFGLAHLHLHWTLGGTVVLDEGLRDIPRFLRRMSAHAITCLAGTPDGFRLLLDGHAERLRAAATTLRYVVINSAPLPAADATRLTGLLPHVRCYTYYGLTEASRSTWLNLNENPERAGTAGRPAPGCELVVGHPGAPRVGEEGEIFIRGPHVTPGYWPLSSGPFAGGWLPTGDLGILDAGGFLTWTGRIAQQINVAGLKVSPATVESVLHRHPAVTDCAVTGMPSPTTGEQVIAFVTTGLPPSPALAITIRRFCAAHLQPHETPRRVEFVPHIPRTPSGKVRTHALLGASAPPA